MLRFCLLAILALGCAQEPVELVLAQVAGEPITASEFRDFDARIPAGMKEGGQRQVLASLIDKKLLLREADAAKMAEDSWFKGELARFKRARLMALYMEHEVVAKIEITPEEIERYYRESGRHRALRLGGIMVESLEEAGAIIDQLAAGADFHELASAHSVHERTAARGGDTGIYQTRDQMSEETVEQVLGLAIGDVAAPVREVFGHEDFYVIYKVLDEIPAPLSASERIIVEE
ncbi:MAG: peptidylprolyl isomerase [Candidatus Latescibacteria bacterium]|nr:peptidylprolyl isomerase [Candidatus Latescibacterota bacterium]